MRRDWCKQSHDGKRRSLMRGLVQLIQDELDRRPLNAPLLITAVVIINTLFQLTTRADWIQYRDAAIGDELYPIEVNHWWGHMNQRGNLVVWPRFDWTDYSYDGRARAVLKGKTGFIKGNGDWLIEPIYDYADRFAEGLAVVGQGRPEERKFGFIDKSGRLRISIRLDGALRFKDGLAGVQMDGRCGFIDVRGKIVIEPQFRRVRSFHNGFAVVQYPGSSDKGGLLGYIDKRGLITFADKKRRFTDLGDFHESLARVKFREHWGYLDRKFRIKIKPQFEDARDFTGGIAAVKAKGKWGFIDKKGRVVSPLRFEEVDDLDNRLVLVKFERQYGFMDRSGRLGIEPQFTFAEPFFRQYARVVTGEGMAYIDLSGRLIWNAGEAKAGFVDNTLKESVTIQGPRNSTSAIRVGGVPGAFSNRPDVHIHNRVRKAPELRPSLLRFYPPDHLYEEVLPTPSKVLPLTMSTAAVDKTKVSKGTIKLDLDQTSPLRLTSSNLSLSS